MQIHVIRRGMDLMYAVEIKNLSKRYKNKEEPALKNINLSINEGETFGLLGPNGAGKTTMVRLILNILKPTTPEFDSWKEEMLELKQKKSGLRGEIIRNLKSKYKDDIWVIDIQGNWENVIDDINRCEFIASSSLHGIITADSYNIPSLWIKMSDKITGGNFKFQDMHYQ